MTLSVHIPLLSFRSRPRKPRRVQSFTQAPPTHDDVTTLALVRKGQPSGRRRYN